MGFYEMTQERGIVDALFYYYFNFITYGWVSEIILTIILILLFFFIIILFSERNTIRYIVGDIINSNKFLIYNVIRENKATFVSLKNIYMLYLKVFLEDKLGDHYKIILIIFFIVLVAIIGGIIFILRNTST